MGQLKHYGKIVLTTAVVMVVVFWLSRMSGNASIQNLFKPA
jgi:hypothetical protein